MNVLQLGLKNVLPDYFSADSVPFKDRIGANVNLVISYSEDLSETVILDVCVVDAINTLAVLSVVTLESNSTPITTKTVHSFYLSDRCWFYELLKKYRISSNSKNALKEFVEHYKDYFIM